MAAPAAFEYITSDGETITGNDAKEVLAKLLGESIMDAGKPLSAYIEEVADRCLRMNADAIINTTSPESCIQSLEEWGFLTRTA